MLGLLEDFNLSSKNNLSNLHSLTLNRCESDFCAVLSSADTHGDDTLWQLIQLNNALDTELVGLDEHYIIKPLRNILYKRNKATDTTNATTDEKCAICNGKFLEVEKIRASWSYRIGRFITWLPRKIRGFIRCYKEHGWSYTFDRILVHLRLTSGYDKKSIFRLVKGGIRCYKEHGLRYTWSRLLIHLHIKKG